MCRLVFYQGDPIRVSALITEPAHSIIHQSYHSREREEPLNGDGFGVGWYAPALSDVPAVFRDVSPAWNDQNLLNLAPVIESHCIVGHIRAATPGLPVTQLNCHPFVHERWLFAHNGLVGGFRDFRRELMATLSDAAYAIVQGSTDSECVFAMLVDELRSAGEGVDAMADAMERTIARLSEVQDEHRVAEASLLNFVLTDGESTLLTRYVSNRRDSPNTLYLHTGRSYECVDGELQLDEAHSNLRAVLVASEPLNHDESWNCVDPNTMLLIDSDLNLRTRRIAVR